MDSDLIGDRYYLPINGQNDKLQAGDNFSYSFGKHDMKFGGDVDTFEDRKDTFVGWSTGQWDFELLGAFSDNLASFQSVQPQALIQDLGLNNIPLFKAGTLFPNYETGLGLYWQDKWQLIAENYVNLRLAMGWHVVSAAADRIPRTGNAGWNGGELPFGPFRYAALPG